MKASLQCRHATSVCVCTYVCQGVAGIWRWYLYRCLTPYQRSLMHMIKGMCVYICIHVYVCVCVHFLLKLKLWLLVTWNKLLDLLTRLFQWSSGFFNEYIYKNVQKLAHTQIDSFYQQFAKVTLALICTKPHRAVKKCHNVSTSIPVCGFIMFTCSFTIHSTLSLSPPSLYLPTSFFWSRSNRSLSHLLQLTVR